MPLKRYPDLALQLLQTESPDTSHLPLDNLDAIYVIGLFEGRPFLQLEAWLAASGERHLVFLEDRLIHIKAALTQPWIEQCLNHPQVHLRFLQKPKEWMLEQVVREFPYARVAVIGRKSPLKEAILRKTVLWHSVKSEVLTGHLLHRNIFSNFRTLPSAFYVNQTASAFAGTPAIICGAGPSLATFIPQLKTVHDRAVVIGCGSALSILAHWNARPHFGIAVDPNAEEKVALSGCTFRDLPLIYSNRLYPEALQFFDGPYGYLRSPSSTALERAIEKELGFTEAPIGYDLGREALSVTTLALSLARFWGCSPIILAGVDLAYAGTAHYAEGAARQLQKKQGEQIIYRKKKATLVKWVMEQATIDAYAKASKENVWMDATGVGLTFSHIPYTPWQEIEAVLPHVSVKPLIEKLMQQGAHPIQHAQLERVLGRFKESFGRSLQLIQLLQHETPGSGKQALYEEDLRAEPIYAPVILPLLSYLPEVDKWALLEQAVVKYAALL